MFNFTPTPINHTVIQVIAGNDPPTSTTLAITQQELAETLAYVRADAVSVRADLTASVAILESNTLDSFTTIRARELSMQRGRGIAKANCVLSADDHGYPNGVWDPVGKKILARVNATSQVTDSAYASGDYIGQAPYNDPGTSFVERCQASGNGWTVWMGTSVSTGVCHTYYYQSGAISRAIPALQVLDVKYYYDNYFLFIQKHSTTDYTINAINASDGSLPLLGGTWKPNGTEEFRPQKLATAGLKILAAGHMSPETTTPTVCVYTPGSDADGWGSFITLGSSSYSSATEVVSAQYAGPLLGWVVMVNDSDSSHVFTSLDGVTWTETICQQKAEGMIAFDDMWVAAGVASDGFAYVQPFGVVHFKYDAPFPSGAWNLSMIGSSDMGRIVYAWSNGLGTTHGWNLVGGGS